MSPGHKWVLWSQLIEWRPNKRLYSIQSSAYCLRYLPIILARSNKIYMNFIYTLNFGGALFVCALIPFALFTFITQFPFFSLFVYSVPFFRCFFLIFLDFLRKNKNAAEWYPCSLSTAPYKMWINAHTLEIECYLNDILLWLFSFLFLTFTTNSSVSASFYFLCLSLHSDIVFFFPGGLYFGGFI